MNVAVTTLTNKTVTLEKLPLTSTIAEVKARYQDDEGVPPDQQALWFPVPIGTEGGRVAPDFKWWRKTIEQLEPVLAAGMMARPLILGNDVMTLGHIGSLQNDGAEAESLVDCTVACYMILSLRASPGEDDNDPSGMVDAAWEDKDLAVLDLELDLGTEDADDSLRKAFRLFDSDGSGKLSAQELKGILTRMGDGNNQLSEADAQEIIDGADKDADGQLDINEFVNLIKSMET